MGADYRPAPIKYMYLHQIDAVIAQAAPVQNTWYPVLPANDDVRIISMAAIVTVANETIEGRIIIDGITIPINPLGFIFNSVYDAVNEEPVNPYFVWSVNIRAMNRAFFIEGQNIAVSIRKTTAAGAGTLNCRIKWARLLPS